MFVNRKMGQNRHFSFMSAFQISFKHPLCIVILCHTQVLPSQVWFRYLKTLHVLESPGVRVGHVSMDTPTRNIHARQRFRGKLWVRFLDGDYFFLLQVVLSYLRYWLQISYQASSLSGMLLLIVSESLCCFFISPFHLFSVNLPEWSLLFETKNFNYTL